MCERVSTECYVDTQAAGVGTNWKAVIQMIKGRLAAVVKKQQMIADANNKEQQVQLQAARRRSGDVTPRSVPSHGSA